MEADIFHIASILRPPSRDIFNGKGKLCLSANYLKKLNTAIDAHIDEDVASFQIVQTSTKSNLIRDIQFLMDLLCKTVSLKITPDETVEYISVDLSKFKNIKLLEIIKLDIHIVTGLQKLRSQIQELTCCRSLKSISDVLEMCGGDKSQPYSWNELRIANLAYNDIVQIDNSFECTLSLHTVDLSHNNISKADFINLLPNLKHLNLSYNKLDACPRFKGQIRNRLQILVLNNNFVEELNGVTSLSNLLQLDLAHNCLLDHKCLLSLSHLVSLQCLNLQGNPLGFHPQHRQMTCNYLNKNASTVKFLLDGIILNKNERSLTGSLYPISQKIQTSSSTNSLESSAGSVLEKPKKIRNVIIEDIEDDDVKELPPLSTPTTPSQHLEIKRQVEQLRNEYGESWLYRHSGLMMQDVLGFDKSIIMSSTPLDSKLNDLCLTNSSIVDTTQQSGIYKTANLTNTTNEVSNSDDFYTAEQTENSNSKIVEDLSDVSDNEDIFSGGEDCMFLATNSADGSQVFVVVTESHISERDVITSKERARWHINTVITCEKSEQNDNDVKLEFDTLRRDRKQRLFELNPEEREAFYNSIKDKIDHVLKTEDNVTYQCMKCSEVFQRNKSALLHQLTVICPRCSSNMVVESV